MTTAATARAASRGQTMLQSGVPYNVSREATTAQSSGLYFATVADPGGRQRRVHHRRGQERQRQGGELADPDQRLLLTDQQRHAFDSAAKITVSRIARDGHVTTMPVQSKRPPMA